MSAKPEAAQEMDGPSVLVCGDDGPGAPLFRGTKEEWAAHPMNADNMRAERLLDDLIDPEAFSACLTGHPEE